MSRLIKVHKIPDIEHGACPDPNCCDCECRTCKHVWFESGRPTPERCPVHNAKATEGPTDILW